MTNSYHYLYVSTSGNDKNLGTIEEPFATLEKAKEAVRSFKKNNPNTDITVFIRGGMHFIHRTIVFGVEDSGNENQTITYAAFPGETPAFSSGKQVSSWRRVKKRVEGIHEKAVGKLWEADISGIKPDGSKMYTLYDGERRLTRSRSPGFTPVNEPNRYAGETSEHTTVYFSEGAPFNAWSNNEDIELIVRGTAVWQMNILPIKYVDLSSRIAKVSIPALYPIGKMLYWLDASESIWIENALDFLDESGKWALNSKEGKIYFWPEGDEPGENIYVPVLKELIRVEGDIDLYGPCDHPVQNIVFRGLTFMHGERDTLWHDYHGYELQHSWDMFDRSNALLRFRGAKHCAVYDCIFKSSGGGAIRLDLSCQSNIISGNLIKHIGGTGILLAGYGPGTKDVNRKNQIVNNNIRNIGEIYWHSPGIFVWQSSENHIAHNLLHELPYTGIVLSGRIVFSKDIAECSKTIRWNEIKNYPWEIKKEYPYNYYEELSYLHTRDNLVEYNEICNVVKVMGDGNGIYISGGGLRNRIYHNYIHHNVSPHFCEAIRCDDMQDGTIIEENVIYKTGGLGTGITSKGINHILNNIVVCPLHTERGMVSFELGPVNGSIVQRNILYTDKKDHKLYYQNRLYGDGPIPKLKDMHVDCNIYYNTQNEGWGIKTIQEERQFGIEQKSMEADPLFFSIEEQDFRLRPDSPAFAIGIKQIDISSAGLTAEFKYIEPDIL